MEAFQPEELENLQKTALLLEEEKVHQLMKKMGINDFWQANFNKT